MGVDHIIFGQPISAIWQALGGDTPRRGRAPAFYRKGDNPGAVSLNDEKGCWYDFVTGGGGVLNLVRRVRGGSRKEALRWLSELVGAPLEERSLRERKAYAVRRAAVQLEATQLARDASDWERGLELLLLRREKTASEITVSLLSEGLDAGSLLIKARNDLAVLRKAGADSLIRAYYEMSKAKRRRLIQSGRSDREHAERVTSLIVGLLIKDQRVQSEAGSA